MCIRDRIVAGCLSQQYQDELFTEIPEIDALIGTGAWDQIMVAVDAIEHGNRSCIMENITNIYDERMPRIQTTPRYSAYVKIAEGCNNGCTFCIIPKVRGAFRSRSIESIKAEVERLAASGVKENVLIAQDTTSSVSYTHLIILCCGFLFCLSRYCIIIFWFSLLFYKLY